MLVAKLLKARVPLLLLLGMAGFLVVSYGYGPEERALPVLVAWVTMALLVLEVLVQAGTVVGDRPEEPPPIGRALRYAIGWTGLLVALTILIGILPAVLVYIALSLKLDGGKPLTVSLATASAVVFFAWLLFEWGLSYDLYRGVFA